MSELVFDAVSVHAGARALVSEVSLTLRSGEFLALVGPNGAGKTTLLRAALGLVRPSSGAVRVDARLVGTLTPRERAAELAWLPQQSLAAEPISALETVLVARYRFDETAAAAARAASDALERVGMQAFARARLSELSGGERQRIAVAALLAQGARFLLVDEPANHLDPARQAETYALLGSLLDAGTGILSVTHDVNLLLHVGSAGSGPRVAGLAAGTLSFDTTLGAAELPDRLAELYGVPMHEAHAGSKRLIFRATGARKAAAVVKVRSFVIAALSLALLALAVLVGPWLEGERGAFIFWELRVPRVLVGTLVGGTLGLVGACFQTLFANPLATESTVGTTAGATLGALGALALDLPPSGAFPAVFVASFAGALAASAAVALVAWSGRARLGDVLLAGITVTLATGALSSGLQYISESHALISAAQWSLGALPQVGYTGVLVLLPIVVPIWLVLLSLARALQTFAFGEELAHARGVNVRRLRFLVLGTGSLAVAAAVAWCGPIAFVGLVVPHLIRLAVGPALGRLLPLSLLGGAAFLVGCDTLARSLVPGRELPVGVVTATLGAPSLVVLLLRARER